jgi:hypothetical protein
MLRTHFIVLVSGDVAEAVCVENADRSRSRFLFHGSRYSSPARPSANGIHADMSSEISPTHIPMRFYSTLSVFDSEARRLATVMDVECAMVLLPSVLRVDQIQLFSDWVKNAVHKSICTSMWLSTDGVCAYHEKNLAFTQSKPNSKRLPH